VSVVKIFASFSNLLFILAILSGVYLPQAAYAVSFLVLPALMLVQTLTLLRFPGGFFHEPKKLVFQALWGNLMNYLILGNLIILGSIFLIPDEKLWIGLVLVAAVPPAVAVLPLGLKVRADKMLILAGFAGTYVGAIILMPLIGIAFLKFIPVHYDKLIILFFTLIILPLILSRIAVDRNWDSRIMQYQGTISNVCFFIVFYALASRNANLIREWPPEIILISVLAFSVIFLVWIVLLLIGWFYKISPLKVKSLMLLGTMKNYGMAGGIALYLFNHEAALPALIFALFMFGQVNLMKFWSRNDLPDKEPESLSPEN
jgi:BASS family bile acid:Na+ symporter